MRSNRKDVIPVALLLASLLCIAACSRPKDNSAATGAGEAPPSSTAERDTSKADTSATTAVPYDLQVIDNMSRHHRDAIAVGHLAATKALHPELREFGPKLATELERQVKLMTQWRGQWYAGTPNAENRRMSGMTTLNAANLDSVSGDAFDRKCLEVLIPHHQGAVVMATEALAKVEHAELKALSQQIMDVQQKEIDMMIQWKSTWGMAP